MNKIYSDSEEKLVKTTIVYGDADEGHLFFEKEHTTKIPKDVLFNLYLKGLTVVYNDEFFKPVSYKESAGAGVVSVIGESLETATVYKFHSAEHGE